MDIIEIVGYAASIMVAISLTMKDIVKLRVINLIGCVLFCIYGYVIGAMPVVVMNGFVVCVNAYFLFKIYKEKDTTTSEE